MNSIVVDTFISRAANPAPGAWTTLNGTQVQIFDSAKLEGDGTPGTVVEVSGDGVIVQAQGGRILVKRVRPKGGDKQSASEWAAGVGLAAGAALGS